MAESIAECLSVRREELRQQLIQSSCAISQAHLVDFDWQVKVNNTICSSYVRVLLEQHKARRIYCIAQKFDDRKLRQILRMASDLSNFPANLFPLNVSPMKPTINFYLSKFYASSFVKIFRQKLLCYTVSYVI